MPQSKSAAKRARQSEERRQRTKPKRTALRTQLKKVDRAIESGEKETAEAELEKAVRMLDRAARKGLIHKNQAARRKSRLSNRVADMA